MPSRYKTMLLFGPPGVGKGTQGKILGNIPGLRHLASGDMFRALDKESELGRQFLDVSSRGDLVSDELTIECWKKHMQDLVAGGCYRPSRDILVLDGIPRSIAQAEAMDDLVNVLKVIHLRCLDIDDMVERIKRRAIMEHRHDDADEAVIRKRFAVYDTETAPVLSHYGPSLIAEVDAVGTPAEVLQRILAVVVPVYNESFDNPLEGPVEQVQAGA
jgi:adenylate kinase